MSVIKKIKENLYLSLVAAAYAAMLITRPYMGIESIKNSVYYIKEMLSIMPVVFVLTALLDLWVPKEKILHFLGRDSGAKGVVLSFVVGSVSAGPIYAAFPMCVMLHKKGASIRNIVIILSSWAVIKLPMLLNEAKFLGIRFMAVRWFLTVAAVVIFSWISSKIIKDDDLVSNAPVKQGLHIDRNACMGCGICAESYGDVFEMQNGKAAVKIDETAKLDKTKLEMAAGACPVGAIECGCQ
jgi:ferredoxin